MICSRTTGMAIRWWRRSWAAAAAGELQRLGIQPGDRIGPFRVVREAGRGGMGTVYEAVREDGQFEQRVAIKMVAGGLQSADAVERFRRERQLLARLEHPNIARLLDGGTTAQGPYLVMEYIEGETLLDYCRELPLRRKLELLLEVCAAVEYAHRRLIIHRDLKPQNVLVTEAGAAKLLDFGIAKLVDDDGSGPRFTGVATPRYASPEQLRGGEVTTASDVYSLGALLYAVLFGKPSEGPEAPVGTAAPRDLSGIAAKALRANPAERYESASLFADDLRRYLDCRPIQARETDPRERFSKFVRRNRKATAVAGALALAAVVGASAAVRQYNRAQAEAERTRNMLNQTLSLSSGPMSDVFRQIDRLSETTAARKELAVATVDFLEKLSAQAGFDPRLRLALARAYYRLGTVQGNFDQGSLGDDAAAMKSFHSATRLIEPEALRAGGPGDAIPLWLDLQANIARMMTEARDPVGAAAVLKAGLDRTANLPMERRYDLEARRSRANLYLYLARALFTTDLKTSLAYASDYLNATHGMARDFPNEASLWYDVSVAENQVAFALTTLGELDQSVGHLQAMIDLRERLAARYPQDVVYRRVLALGYEHMAGLEGSPLAPTWRPDLARAYYEKERPIKESLSRDDPSTSTDHALLRLKMALVDPPEEQLTGSLAVLREAAASFQRFADQNDQARRYEDFLIVAHEHLGLRLTRLKRYTDALTEFHQAKTRSLALLQKIPGDWQALSFVLRVDGAAARAQALAGDRAGAEESARQMVMRAQAGAEIQTDHERRMAYLARAYSTQAFVYDHFHERPLARVAAESAIAAARPLLTGRAWDFNGPTMREAETILGGVTSQAVADVTKN